MSNKDEIIPFLSRIINHLILNIDFIFELYR